MTPRQAYYSYHHFTRKAIHYAKRYEMGEDSAFVRQVYAQLDAVIWANRLHGMTGRWM